MQKKRFSKKRARALNQTKPHHSGYEVTRDSSTHSGVTMPVLPPLSNLSSAETMSRHTHGWTLLHTQQLRIISKPCYLPPLTQSNTLAPFPILPCEICRFFSNLPKTHMLRTSLVKPLSSSHPLQGQEVYPRVLTMTKDNGGC